MQEEEAQRFEPNCYPIGDAGVRIDQEIVRVLCVDPESAFAAPISEHKPRARGSKRTSDWFYDPPWNICRETLDLQRQRWSDPPGSQWVNYCRLRGCFDPPHKPPIRRRLQARPLQVVRYALDSVVLPLATEALPIAEQARRALMGIYGRLTERNGVRSNSPVFSGKDVRGRPLTGHRHAFYLPADEDGDGRLDHLTIVAEEGFDDAELRTLDRLRHLQRENGYDLRLLLVALGRWGELQVSLLDRARRWASATPFLVTRHPKKNGRKRDPVELLSDPPAFVEAVLREELARFLERRGHRWRVDEVRIERLEDPPGVFRIMPAEWAPGSGAARLRPIEFKRFRSRKLTDDGGWRRSGAFRLSFPEPILGPVCLGHSIHFGMGLFLPTAEDVS
jgi:CRISPR-associated protein Csb2